MTPRMAEALDDVVEAEEALAREFRRVSDRHVADADVHHLCRRLAGECDRHAELLVSLASCRGEKRASPSPPPNSRHAVRRRFSKLNARSDKAGPVLLRDLRTLYLRARACEVAWTILGQGARAQRDRPLVDLVYACGLETARQAQWVEARLKEAAPQVLAG
jgi:hypothetical protein